MGDTIAKSPQSSRNTSPIQKNTLNTRSQTMDSSSGSTTHTTTPAASFQRTQSTATSTAPSSPTQSVPPSPRIKSPPPPTSRRSSVSSARVSDPDGPDQLRQSFSGSAGRSDPPDLNASPGPTTSAPAQGKTPRGPSGRTSKLETVQEGDHSASPNEPSALLIRAEEEGSKKARNDADTSEKRARAPHSSSQTADSKKGQTTTHPTLPSSTSSAAQSKVRGNPGEGSSKLMTVETETVSSIPQTVMSSNSERVSSGRGDGTGALRVKPSHETIKLKKEKRRHAKKPSSMISTAGSSKADIFEAKVASEIEGGDTDSDETFVYESNPPEARRQNRHRSRTPSSASHNTVADRKATGPRAAGTMRSSDQPVRQKRSMKFASGGNSAGGDDDDTADGDMGTVRTPSSRVGLRKDLHAKSAARLGRSEGPNDSSLDESPFSQASRLRVATGLGAQASLRSSSPRSTTPSLVRTPVKKGHSDLEYDSGNGVDERTPLMGSLRTPKTRNSRHARHSQLQDVEYYGEPRSHWLRRLIGYVIVALFAASLVLFAAGLLYLTARPLYAVSIQEIRNVLASEQEIMLDLLVKATNPNIAQITISNMDINVFAKSSHIGEPAVDPVFNITGGVDEGTDPIGDPESDHQTMLLGRIFHFDSALTFDPSPIRRQPQKSIGELRLAKPGNKTETGGSARWERVLHNQFELIVRGVLRYELPLSTQTYSSSVGARVLVKPEEGVDDMGGMHLIQLGHLPPIGKDGEVIDSDLPNE